jgi:hypothetical protein
MKSKNLVLALSLTPLTFCVAPVAHADPNSPTDDDKAAARPFAVEGIRLAQAGSCREAIDRLDRAEALVHAPVTALPLGQCQIRLGKLVAGTETLARVVGAPLPPGAPAAWVEAKQSAQAALDAARPRISRLRIHVDVPPGVAPNPEVSVDAEPMSPAFLDHDRPTDPGVHHVAVHQAGLKSAETDVELTEGAVRSLTVRLEGATGFAPVVASPQAAGDPYGSSRGLPQTPPPANAGSYDPYGAGATTPAPAMPSPPDARGQANIQPESPAASTAPASPAIALELGARVAFGAPFGGATGTPGADLNHVVSNTLAPLWLDAGVRIASNWYVGGSFAYGVASTSDQLGQLGCNQVGVSCSASDVRLGANVQYHAIPGGRFDPWLGAGGGYEWLSLNVGTASGQHESSGLSGWELVNLQAGLDFRVPSWGFGVGPFASVTFAQYSSASVPSDQNGGTVSQTLSNQGIHEWVLVGVRGDYDLKLQ